MSADQVAFHHTYEIAILGNDMVLAARPARVVQLVHALYECGYELVVPLSWGEELLAQYTLDNLARAHEDTGPRILCVCPKVRHRLVHAGRELNPHVLVGVAPPVAAARFLRALQPDAEIRITYIGACEGAKDAAIDTRVLPADLLRHLDKLGVVIADQPTVFESIVPPDRRRHWSVPGGAPSLEALRETAGAWVYREIPAGDLVEEIAESILANDCALIDLASSVGCHCAGASSGRETVTAMEPPRAGLPVVSGDLVVALELGTEALKRPIRIPSLLVEPEAGELSDHSTSVPPRRYAVTPASVVQLLKQSEPPEYESGDDSAGLDSPPAVGRPRPAVHEVWSVARSASHTRDRRRRTPKNFTAFAAMLPGEEASERVGEPHPVPAPLRPQTELPGEPAPISVLPAVESGAASPIAPAVVARDVATALQSSLPSGPPAPHSDDAPRVKDPREVSPPSAVDKTVARAGTPTEEEADLTSDDVLWGPPEVFTISRPAGTQGRPGREPRRVPGPGPARRTQLWLRLLFVALIIASTVLILFVFRYIGG